MGRKQKYTSEYRESAVKLVITEGRRVEDEAANLGMPANTLAMWASRARKYRLGGRGFHDADRGAHTDPLARTLGGEQASPAQAGHPPHTLCLLKLEGRMIVAKSRRA